jgi:SAM-dependent methyltransferase
MDVVREVGVGIEAEEGDMAGDGDEDVPIRVDFRDPATARAWIEDTRTRILELGSGPGQLAREILSRCDVRTYVALDFSLREGGWPDGLGEFDAIVTLQAAHETRHKRHLVPLLERARTLLAPGGILLYADHYLTPETKLPALALARDDQPLALERAGFVDVRLHHEEGNMALWAGTARS